MVGYSNLLASALLAVQGFLSSQFFMVLYVPQGPCKAFTALLLCVAPYTTIASLKWNGNTDKGVVRETQASAVLHSWYFS